MPADVKLEVSSRGQGSILVDGVDMSSMVAGAEVRTFAGEGTKVTLHLTPVALKDFTIQADTIEIKGSTIPSAVELALWQFLKAKFDPAPRLVDVTSCDSLVKEFASDRVLT